MPDTFAPFYYLNLYPDVLNSPFFGNDAGQAARHYKHWGVKEGRSPNPFFDPQYYLERYSDLVAAFGSDNYPAALEHWLRHGIFEGRRGSPIFDPKYYLASYPDLVSAFGAVNYPAAYDHWLRFGINEQRKTIPELDRALFNVNGIIPNETSINAAINAGKAGAIIELLRKAGPVLKEGANKVIDILGKVVTVKEVLDILKDVKTPSEKGDKVNWKDWEPKITHPGDGSLDGVVIPKDPVV